MFSAMRIDQAINRIKAYVATCGMPKERIAEQAHLHRNTLVGMNRPEWSPNADTLRKLEAIIPPDFDAQEVA